MSITVDNPPDVTRLPTYLELDYGTDDAEVIRVVNVSGSTITIERGINTGGSGILHENNALWKQKITSTAWQLLIDAMVEGYLTIDDSFTFARVSTSSFKITAAGVDKTALFTKGRMVRINGSTVVTVVSSSYSNPDTTVTTVETTVPTPITSIEVGFGPKSALSAQRIYPASIDVNSSTVVDGVVDEDAMTSDSATKLATQQSIKAYVDSLAKTSLLRQAIINGNFDVWQRGTSFANSASGAIYTSDRWKFKRGSTTGATLSRQDGTGVVGSQYCARVQRDSGNTSTVQIELRSPVETANAIKFRGNIVTLSFWARKGANYSATSDVLQVQLTTGTGTDEDPFAGYTGAASPISQNATLTSSWQKFTYSTAAVIGATVNEFSVNFAFDPIGTAGASDYYEISQIQLNIGSVALPFQAREYGEELRACQRYCYVNTSAATGFPVGQGHASSTTVGYIQNNFVVSMRVTPTLTATAADWQLNDFSGAAVDVTALTITPNSNTERGILEVTVAAGLTQFRPYYLLADGTGNRKLTFESEL